MDRMLCIVLTVTLLGFTAAAVEKRQQAQNKVRPAFSVGLSKNHTYVTPENVLYDRVFLDTTNGYNPQTGEYTVPITGEYVVMFHAVAELDGQIHLDLKRNSETVLSAYAHTSTDYASTGNVGVLHFAEGDTMHVVGKGSSILYAYSGEVYCTLSAYLLYSDKPDHGHTGGR